jgi:hypothetical protein
MKDKVQKKKIVNFSHVVFCPAYDDLAMQALVWLGLLQLRVVRFGVVIQQRPIWHFVLECEMTSRILALDIRKSPCLVVE